MMRTRTDPKIERIRSSWLALSPAAAEWLAGIADELIVDAGLPVGDDGFGYVSLSADATIATAAHPVTFSEPTRVLAVRDTDLALLRARLSARLAPAA